jgi:hypothetical protein
MPLLLSLTLVARNEKASKAATPAVPYNNSESQNPYKLDKMMHTYASQGRSGGAAEVLSRDMATDLSATPSSIKKRKLATIQSRSVNKQRDRGIILTQSINNKTATNIGERAIRPHL